MKMNLNENEVGENTENNEMAKKEQQKKLSELLKTYNLNKLVEEIKEYMGRKEFLELNKPIFKEANLMLEELEKEIIKTEEEIFKAVKNNGFDIINKYTGKIDIGKKRILGLFNEFNEIQTKVIETKKEELKEERIPRFFYKNASIEKNRKITEEIQTNENEQKKILEVIEELKTIYNRKENLESIKNKKPDRINIRENKYSIEYPEIKKLSSLGIINENIESEIDKQDEKIEKNTNEINKYLEKLNEILGTNYAYEDVFNGDVDQIYLYFLEEENDINYESRE